MKISSFLLGYMEILYYICTVIKNVYIMKEAIEFATWMTYQTKDVNTMGACRLYKNRTYNIKELYEIWINLN